MNEEINKKLIKWYQKSKRDLPWRKDHDAYHIWISEIMLQQTRVQAVIPYYERFITSIPNLYALSIIEEEKLLKLWEGLGYYSRVKNMQKCAKMLIENGKTKLPHTYKELLQLPGIGPYTAGAIASIAYKEKVCAVDGNVLRVTARILNSFANISETKTKKKVEAILNKSMPEESGTFNQALMELGATICIPLNPRCNICPISSYCTGYKKGNMYKLPIKNKKGKQKEENVTVFLLCYKDKIAIRKRPNKGLLASLFEFPNEMKIVDQNEIQNLFSIDKIEKVHSYTHVFTHKIWHMDGYKIRLKEKPNGNYIWTTLSSLQQTYSLPTAFSYFLKDLEKN